jgi:hypothetical protein
MNVTGAGHLKEWAGAKSTAPACLCYVCDPVFLMSVYAYP